MYKTVDTDSWDNNSLGGQMIPVSSRGLMPNDSAAFFKKTAASERFLHEINNIKLADGEIPIHLNAIGSTAYFSCNRKGDAFSEKTCKEAHHTFVDEGKVYTHHHNRDPKRNFGKIASSCYNDNMHRIELLIIANGNENAAKKNAGLVLPDEFLSKLEKNAGAAFSMGCTISHDECLTEGTLIATREGYRPIETIRRGEFVWTHEGNLYAVNTIFQNWSANVGTMKVAGAPRIEGVTGNHPVLAVKRELLYDGTCSGSVNGEPVRHTRFDGRVCGRCGKRIELTPEWIPASELRKGDFVVTPIDKATNRKFYAGRFSYLLGVYLGNGCITCSRKKGSSNREDKVGGISIACNANQDTIHANIIDACKSVSDGKIKCYRDGADKSGRVKQGLALNLTDRELALRLQRFGGEYSRYKRLDPEVYRWSDEEKAGIIAGYIDTDGWVDKKRGAIVITSINKGLLLEIQRLCFSIGIAASVGIHNNNPKSYLCHSEASYRISIPFIATEILKESTKVSEAVSQRSVTKDTTRSLLCRYENQMLLPIVEPWTKIPLKKEMTRVFNIRVNHDESYIVNGFAVHNCSVCGNKARTAAEYCTEDNCQDPKTGEWGFGCRHGLAKIASNGRIQYVENVEPHFFDISFVGCPADRSAYGFRADYLEKKAGWFFDAALEQTAEPETYTLNTKTASAEYRSAVSAMLYKLAEYERSLSQGKLSVSDALTVHGLNYLYSSQSGLDTVLGVKTAAMPPEVRMRSFAVLANNGITLSPEAFALAIGLNKEAALEIRTAPQGLYNSLYRKYSDFNFDVPAMLLSRMQDSRWDKSAMFCLNGIAMNDYCLNQQTVYDAAPKGILAQQQYKTAGFTGTSYELSEAYALYKTAALCCFPNEMQDFGVKSAVLQMICTI